jgi:preprotein translocase subunit Sss1
MGHGNAYIGFVSYIIRMPLCKICTREYSIESTVAYEAAPGWDDECWACTRRKFEAYVKDYLLENFTVKELSLRAEAYFALTRGTISDLDEKDPVAEYVTTSVLDQKVGEGGTKCVTPGDAVAQFVEYFDKRVKHLEKVLSKRARRSVSKMCIAGALLVGIVAFIILLSSYLVGIH